MTIDAPLSHEIPALRQLWKEAFADSDSFLDTFFAIAYSPARCRRILINGTAAAALYWFDCDFQGRKLAYLYAVATGKAFQGQGLCRRLMEDTHRHLKALGYAGALLVPGSKALFAMYEKLGYRTCSEVDLLTCPAAGPVPAFRRVSREEYTAARRALLPPEGVFQEGISIVFLESQADLYAGEGFLLAARKEEDLLTGLELLGDPTAAPGIVTALGCREGRFRVPGTGIPFAMYCPLLPGPAPKYLGLAFD